MNRLRYPLTPIAARVAPGLVLALWTAILYFPALSHPFVYDDQWQIVTNESIHSLRAASVYFRQLIDFETSFGANFGGFYRPLFWLTFVADRHFWGLDPAGFHATNIVLHWLNGLLIYLLLRRWLAPMPAFVSSATWISLPLHTEVVAWISGRSMALATTFILLSVMLSLKYAERRTAKTLVFLALTTSAALLSHEAGIVAPLLALLAVPLVTSLNDRKTAILAVFLSTGLSAGACLLLRTTLLDAGRPGIAAFPELLLRAPLSFAKYVWWTIHAPPMSMERSTELAAATLTSASYALAWLTIIAIGALAIWLRHSAPMFSIGVVATSIVLLPFLQILPLYQSMAERYTYTASIGILVMAVGVLRWAQTRLGLPRWTVVAALCLWVAMSVGPLRQRIAAWSSNRSVYTTSLRTSPQSYVLHSNLGVLEEEAGQAESAVAFYKKAIALKPDYLTARSNLANLYLRGRRLPEAEQAFRELLVYSPEDHNAQLNIATIMLVQGRTESAIAAFDELLRTYPNSYEGHVNIGVALLSEKDPKARGHLQTALRLRPDSASAAYNLGVLEEEAGQIDVARKLYQQALANDPKHGKAAEKLRAPGPPLPSSP